MIPHPGHWGAAPVAHQARSAPWPSPGARAGLPICRILVAKVQDPHFLLELLEMTSSRANAVSALGATDLVLPSPMRGSLPKAKFSHEIFLFRGNEIFQPFALATPLYSVNFRLSGGELLRLCSVVR